MGILSALLCSWLLCYYVPPPQTTPPALTVHFTSLHPVRRLHLLPLLGEMSVREV